mgnify:CR=1 FL=1
MANDLAHGLSMEKERIMSDQIKVSEIFGEDVFNDSVMQERLPKKVYKEPLPPAIILIP